MSKVKAYVGVFARDAVNENGDSIYDILRIEDRDDEVLRLMYNDAAGAVLAPMGDYVSGKTDDKLTISMPVRCNEYLFADVGNMVELALVNRITAQWFDLKYPPKAEQFYARADEAVKSAVEKLFFKMEPKRKSFGTT